MKRKKAHFLPAVMAFCTVISCNPAVTAFAAEDVNLEENIVMAEENVQPYAMTHTKSVELTNRPKSIHTGSVPHYAYGMTISVINATGNPGVIYAALTDDVGNEITTKAVAVGREVSLGLATEAYQVMVYTSKAYAGEVFKVSVVEEAELIK